MRWFLLLTMSVSAVSAQPLVNIETVLVGDAGNAGRSGSLGRVNYDFSIGKYEVTVGQYAAFLNAVAATNGDPFSLYHANMASDLNIAGISRSAALGSIVYTVITNYGNSANLPITYVSWFDAARFCNWLHNGATNGADTETGAYTLQGITNGGGPARNPDAKWWIPTESEQFKAAFYKGGGTNAGYWAYPTQSDSPPGNLVGADPNRANYYVTGYSVTQSWIFSALQRYLTDVGAFAGSASAYGTFDQGGSVTEWTDPNDGGTSRHRYSRGGNWSSENIGSGTTTSISSIAHRNDFGFRVAGAAAPTTLPPTTNVILTVETTTNLSGQWQFDREINIGPMTNTNEFYRLKIRTVVK